VQDRNAGDVGDFVKLGLLRWLVAPSPFSRSNRLGVVWFRVADERDNADGDHVSYLDPTSAMGGDLRPLDADLYDRLRGMVAAGHRSVNSLAACGVLPKDTLYFDEVLTFPDLAPRDRAALIVRRERWFHKAMIAVEPCSLVFLDPDDGLCRDDDAPSNRSAAEKHAYVSEVGRLLERGQSVIAYHHADRSETVEAQAASRMNDIREALGVEPLAAVRARRDTNRMFLVIPHPRHRSDLEDRLGALQLSRWGDELRLHRWQRNKALARTR
jgi:hypothetical protein